MAQNQPNNHIKIEKVILGDNNHDQTLVWSFRESDLDKIMSKSCGTKFVTEEKHAWFNVACTGNDVTVHTKWYLELSPHGLENDRNGQFDIIIALAELPWVTSSLKVRAVTGTKIVKMPQINFRCQFHSTHDDDEMTWYWTGKALKSQDVVEQIVKQKMKMDIEVTLSVEHMIIERHLNLEAPNPMLLKLVAIESAMAAMSKQIDAMDAKLQKAIRTSDNDLKDDHDAAATDEYNYNLGVKEFKEWILGVFKGNSNTAEEYIGLIVNKEGFDSLDEFVKLSETDLKEIGIDKKGHRLKFMTKMKQVQNSQYGDTTTEGPV